MSAAIEHAKGEKQRNDQLMKLAEENAAFHKLIEEHQHIDVSAREAEQRKKAALQALHKMDEHIDPEAYMQNFEQTLREGELPEREWNNILRKQVSGKVLEAFRELDLTIPYQTLKTSLLERLGCTDTRARKTIWRNAPTDNLSPRHHLTPIMKSINRLTARMESKKDIAMEMFRGALTLYYSPETCHAVRSNSYKNTQDIIDELEATWESKSFHDRSKMHRRQAEGQHFNGRKMSYNSREQTSTNGSGGCLTKGKDGGAPTEHGRVGSQGVTGGPQRVRSFPKDIVCFECNETGHTKRYCPNGKAKAKLGMISSGSEAEEMQELLRTGNINGRLCRCLSDTGANRTTVPDRLVPMECFTGKTAKARLANQGIVTLRTATIDLKVDGISKSMEAFVVGEDTKHVLLGKDHPCVRSWIAGRSKQSEWVDDPVPLATITRAQSQALAAEEVANEIGDSKDGTCTRQLPLTQDSKDGTCTRQLPLTQTKPYAKPIPKPRRKKDTQPPMACKPVDLVSDIEKLLTESEEVSISTSLPVEEDTHSKSAIDDEVTEESFGNCEAGNLQGLEGGCLSEQPLPTLAKGKAEVLALTTQQKEDGMLNEMRCRADRQEDGYFYQGGVLVHSKLADPGREFTRVVVPSCRRKEILDAGHRGLAGGHFSHNKMVSMITQHFTWPGLRKHVREYCSTCPECQKAGRKLQPKVPMVVIPIISRPYERMACDLVGPLQRTTTGYKYILTMM